MFDQVYDANSSVSSRLEMNCDCNELIELIKFVSCCSWASIHVIPSLYLLLESFLSDVNRRQYTIPDIRLFFIGKYMAWIKLSLTKWSFHFIENLFKNQPVNEILRIFFIFVICFIISIKISWSAQYRSYFFIKFSNFENKHSLTIKDVFQLCFHICLILFFLKLP